MPHIELKHSNDLNIDAPKLFADIEQCFNGIDSSAGDCKSRAYPTDQYLHTHVYLHVSLLPKPHRDDEFMHLLIQSLRDCATPYLPTGCWLSIDATFSSPYYLTEK